MKEIEKIKTWVEDKIHTIETDSHLVVWFKKSFWTFLIIFIIALILLITARYVLILMIVITSMIILYKLSKRVQ